MKFKEKIKGIAENLKVFAGKIKFNPFSGFKKLKEKIKTKKEEKKFVSKIEKNVEEKKKRKEAIRKQIDLKDLRLMRLKQKKKKTEKYELKKYLGKAGLSFNPKVLSKRLFNICVFLNLLFSAYVIYFFSTNYNYTLYHAIINMLLMWTVVFIVLLILIWLSFHIMLDLRIFHRKVTLEVVLPDFLQLTSANIRAGMPIDQSLWYAVRPRFGILAKEIELVAKETMGGVDLKDALISFSNKYNSSILKRSISMLIEGMEAGGEVGDLLNKIASNIHNSQIMKKEMAANVTTYIIFISFASLLAAPFLFALSSQLLGIMTKLVSSVNMPTGMGFSFSKVSIERTDFIIYSVVSLVITAFFSSIIVAIIRTGSVKGGFKYIPRFILTVMIVYFLALWGFDKIFMNLL